LLEGSEGNKRARKNKKKRRALSAAKAQPRRSGKKASRKEVDNPIKGKDNEKE
jgi:hypothetical protein